MPGGGGADPVEGALAGHPVEQMRLELAEYFIRVWVSPTGLGAA